MSIELHNGDCLEVMRGMDDNSVDSIVTDPPYGISFMAKKWDYDVPQVDVWQEALRVLKPGGHMLCACGTRTQHRMVCNIEDAGFEVRDVVSWIYGSGFPKSLNISKAIDKAAGAEREDVGKRFNAVGQQGERTTGGDKLRSDHPCYVKPTGTTPAAQQWDGWGTALKPACEFFTLARKPLSEKTIAANVLRWGTGGVNVDGCRVESGGDVAKTSSSHSTQQDGWDRPWRHDEASKVKTAAAKEEGNRKAKELGRFPANLIHDGSQEVLDLFPESKSSSKGSAGGKRGPTACYAQDSHTQTYERTMRPAHGDKGTAARFFYCAKASKRDRDEGCGVFEEKPSYMVANGSKTSGANGEVYERNTKQRNNHPTVKPTDLMRYLCRLITPPQGTVLDPYMGSGSTGKAAMLEGFSFTGCELDADYYEIAKARIEAARN